MPDDVTVADAAAAELEQGADALGFVDGDTSAETENTETPEHGEPKIPKSRLDEVIAQRNELREKYAAMEARLAALEKPAERQEAAVELDTPPENLSRQEQIDWYVERGAKKLIKRELGMDLSAVKTLLGTLQETSRQSSIQQWKSMCSEHGIDPANQEAQEVMSALLRSGFKTDDAIKRVAKYLKPAPAKPTAKVETDSVAGVMATDAWFPRTAREAADGAAKGKKAAHLSLDEILQRSLEAEKKG